MSCILDCYVVRSQRNFHQAIRAKYMKNLRGLSVLYEFPYDDSFGIETYSNVERRSKLCLTDVFYFVFT